ncbi:MAG: type IV secretion system DNA-binding domain-containing protein [Candidatus Saccharimonadales bacterium]
MARFSTKPKPSEHDETGVVLLLQVPRTNDKKELAAEQMFASLHGLLTIPSHKFLQSATRERISFEVAVLKKRIGFYVWVPKYLESFVEEQIYAQYPTVQISEVPDYSVDPDVSYSTTLVTEMKMIAPDPLPIKTFQSFEVDPLAAITATLAKFEEDEEAWIQMVVRPASSNWHKKSERYVAGLKSGGGSMTTGLAEVLWKPPEYKEATAAKLTDYQQTRASAAEEKSQKLAFETSLKIVYRGNVPEPQARLRIQSIIASYKQFNTTYLNGFEHKKIAPDGFMFGLYQLRQFNKQGSLLNIEEVATLYHLPHTTVETPYILWASSQTAEPPANLPIVTSEYRADVSPVANTNFRGHNTMFGMPRSDRGRHLYIIGQTGVGKSGLLELLTISDIYSPFGFAVVDPHGDYAQNILRRIPADRAQDVIYFNPADTEFPVAFNPMEVSDPKLKNHTASELIGVLKRMFESWGPRLEYILRYSLLALLDYPNSTMLDITRILTDKKFRNEVLKYVEDPVVQNFWTIEFASWNDKFAAEAVAPVLNKVGAFVANPLVRNIIGQPKSSFNIRQIMDERKILIVNLTRGIVGEDNASILGALLVTKIQLASMSRADVPAEQRWPFYLYVDEFQNFATDSFATILSEARKYGLNLTVANQYISQMPIEVKDAVFGNVGSIVAFRMGADDAGSMQRYFEPKFLEYDLVHMHNRHFVVSMTIEGEKVPAFSAVSLNLPPQNEDNTAMIIDRSRAQYAVSRGFVERYVNERYSAQAIAAPQATAPRQPAQPARPVAISRPAAAPVPEKAAASPSSSSEPTATGDEPKRPKRKRTRKRKNNTATPPDSDMHEITSSGTVNLK